MLWVVNIALNYISKHKEMKNKKRKKLLRTVLTELKSRRKNYQEKIDTLKVKVEDLDTRITTIQEILEE